MIKASSRPTSAKSTRPRVLMSVCVFPSFCVCVSVYTITQKIMVQST